MLKKKKCVSCQGSFSLKGGNYNRHLNACSGKLKPKIDKFVCLYCGFEDKSKSFGVFGNHVRWCNKNIENISYRKANNRFPSQLFTNEAIEKRKRSISNAHKRGCYDYSKLGHGRKHTEETKKLLSQKALASSHRRLKKNVILYKGVLLDSTWELLLAERLDELGVVWVRPSPLKWIDKNGISHNYFPDFYLPKYNIFLDPKNPFAYKKQKEKINVLMETYDNIIFLISKKQCEEFTI